MATVTRKFQHALSVAEAKSRCDKAFDHYRSQFPGYTITVTWPTATEAKVGVQLTPMMKIACTVTLGQSSAQLNVTYPDAINILRGGKKMVEKYIDVVDAEIRSWLERGRPSE
jgi:hypothetical protein